MKLRPFHTTKLPPIGQGTWKMEEDDRESCIESIQRGIDAGLNHIDTAELYGAGKVEEIVREAIGAYQREDVFLASKVLPENASKKGTIESCEKSLTRLAVERLDLYMLHWAGEHPLEDTIASLEKLVTDGKIARWGLSNFDLSEMKEALRIAGPGKIACNQVLYHLQQRAIEVDLIPWCEKQKIPVVAYSPFGSGRFPDPSSKGGRALASVADAHDATPHQVALAFLTRNSNVFAIPKTSDPTHATENAEALGLTLTNSEIALLDSAFPVKRLRSLPSL